MISKNSSSTLLNWRQQKKSIIALSYFWYYFPSRSFSWGITCLSIKIFSLLLWDCKDLNCQTHWTVTRQRTFQLLLRKKKWPGSVCPLSFILRLVKLVWNPWALIYFGTFLLRTALPKPRARWDGWLRRAKWTREFGSRPLRPPVLRARRPTHPPTIQPWRKVSPS